MGCSNHAHRARELEKNAVMREQYHQQHADTQGHCYQPNEPLSTPSPPRKRYREDGENELVNSAESHPAKKVRIATTASRTPSPLLPNEGTSKYEERPKDIALAISVQYITGDESTACHVQNSQVTQCELLDSILDECTEKNAKLIGSFKQSVVKSLRASLQACIINLENTRDTIAADIDAMSQELKDIEIRMKVDEETDANDAAATEIHRIVKTLGIPSEFDMQDVKLAVNTMKSQAKIRKISTMEALRLERVLKRCEDIMGIYLNSTQEDDVRRVSSYINTEKKVYMEKISMRKLTLAKLDAEITLLRERVSSLSIISSPSQSC